MVIDTKAILAEITIYNNIRNAATFRAETDDKKNDGKWKVYAGTPLGTIVADQLTEDAAKFICETYNNAYETMRFEAETILRGKLAGFAVLGEDD